MDENLVYETIELCTILAVERDVDMRTTFIKIFVNLLNDNQMLREKTMESVTKLYQFEPRLFKDKLQLSILNHILLSYQYSKIRGT